jgi:hypothetical protein
MAFEPVYMVWDLYDGVRSGLACYGGAPHYFECELDNEHGGYSEVYLLWPIGQQLLMLATEQWQLYRAWEMRFHLGEVPLETHPGHRGQNPRYDELEDQIDRNLNSLGTPTGRAFAEFQPISDQPELPEGCLREMEVEWRPVGPP